MMIMTRRWMTATVFSFGVAAMCLTGCEVDVGGQTLPSPVYTDDGIQYFAPTSENKLSRENAAMKAYRADQVLQGRAP
jgi:hypothetical protein